MTRRERQVDDFREGAGDTNKHHPGVPHGRFPTHKEEFDADLLALVKR
jgi:hypothetical protein